MTITTRRERISPKLMWIMIAIHALGLLGVGYLCLVDNNLSLILGAVAYYYLIHISITDGAHRYFTHEAYQLKPWLAYTLAVIFSGASQNSLYWWVGKHLEHHQFEDQRGKDPHTPHDGFWHSHMLWMLKPNAQLIPKTVRARFLTPSTRNNVVNWHRRNHRKFEVLMMFVVPGILGLVLGRANDFAIGPVLLPGAIINIIGGVLVIGFTRLVFQYHGTWVVNSVGHSFGKPVDATARNFWGIFSPLCGLLTVGEAHHANHHVAPGHWKLGRSFWQLDPGAWVARVWRTLGWAYDFKEPPNRRRSRTFT